MSERLERVVGYSFLVVSVLGFLVSFPLWLADKISDRAMLGLTLVLSWAALWYAAFIAIQAMNHAAEQRRQSSGGER